jgi:acetyl-CoA acyltransferase
MAEPVIVEAVRTPFGRRGGVFRDTRPEVLLAHALKNVTRRAGLSPDEVEDVVTGCVTQIGEQGANIGRLAVLLAGFPKEVPAVSLNRMCGSGQQAVHFAAQEIAGGDATYAIGCGVESMTRVEMASDTQGKEFNPDITTNYPLVHQGVSAEMMAEKWGISREDLDEFSARSHRRAARAAAEGWNLEIAPMEGLDKEGNSIEVTADEGIRNPVDPVKMAALPTVFRPDGDGVVTAGNASQISDGAGAVLVADREAAEAAGLRPRARFLARVAVGDDPTLQLSGVIPATRKALERTGLSLDDIDWIEINEAFASVPLAWAREFGVDPERINPWGGAVAHGHPLGATGVGLMAKMVAALEHTGGRLGLQTMCIGHGMATASIIERI